MEINCLSSPNPIGGRYGVALPPAHYLINDGILRGVYLGFDEENKQDLKKLLREILQLSEEIPVSGRTDLLPPY